MSTRISKILCMSLIHLRGKNLEKIVKHFSASNLAMFEYQNGDEYQFVAKLGEEEFLLNQQGFNMDLVEAQQYAFQRGDAVFRLSGQWLNLMSEVCVYDFRQARPGNFLMVLVAGISVWMLVPESNGDLIIGCDPTYGHYLYETLQNQINVSPFLNSGVSS